MVRWFVILLALVGRVGIAAAEPVSYAIVVGSNTGGPGQADLHFAEDDAHKVAALLVELGGYAPAQVDVVVHPTPDELRGRLAALQTKVEADAAAGRQARVFFYYSGHARAQAIDLGADELPLTELRERLFKVPATLTVVVLDACQSGAFSRVKGAAPAADFSFSSRQHLDAAGVAILASSSGSELSQESEELRGSYFTHNLLVGLRGAGDANNDGEVSIDEAYRYAYHQTLLATAETAVGGQHVTFEADLKGHGEVALSFPRVASAALVLPPAMAGKALVEDKRANTVVAEIYKAKGAALRIAVAPGDYDVLVRDGDVLERCDVVAPGMVELGQCRREAIVDGRRKGGGWAHPYRFELFGALGNEHADNYTRTLTNFGYSEDGFAISSQLGARALRRVADNVWVGAQFAWDAMPSWSKQIVGDESQSQSFDWRTQTLTLVGRYTLPFNRAAGAYGQAQLGAGMGESTLTPPDGMSTTTVDFGFAASAGGGIYIDVAPWSCGMMFGYDYEYAPVIKDLIGDTHATGGNRLSFALVGRL
jgi:Caspase domain/Outer membrane protein beta-barrel domain